VSSRAPRWYKLVWATWASLLVAVSGAYFVGAGGIRAGTVRMAFERDRPQQLLRLDDTRAFLVESGMISIVRYERTNPLVYVCGCFAIAGRIANGVDRQLGSWVYTSRPGQPRYGADAMNLATGETIVVKSDRDDPGARQELVARGLDPAGGEALTPEPLAATRDTLWLRKESCLTWLLAFYAAGALLLVLAPIAILQARRRTRPAVR
jgi:hypothetical protein